MRETEQLIGRAALVAIAKKLSDIDKKLDKRVPYMLADDAVDAFRRHIVATQKRPDNFDHVISAFLEAFRGRNVAEITPDDVESFAYSRWGDNSPATINKRIRQLGLFFQFCINALRKRGAPDFHNPCPLVTTMKEPGGARTRSHAQAGQIKQLLATFDNDKHWLMAAIQLTAGLRVNEVLKLRPKDVSGRVLQLVEPKSGRDVEHAVIPQRVANKLAEFLGDRTDDDPIFGYTSRQVVNRLLKRHAASVGLELTTHDLRRWCATFWDRLGEYSMRRFVLRHSSVKGLLDPLEGRYVAGLSPFEAMAKQDELMEFINCEEEK